MCDCFARLLCNSVVYANLNLTIHITNVNIVELRNLFWEALPGHSKTDKAVSRQHD